MKGLRAKSIILVSGKGGVGKSTISVALAAALAAEGQKVLVVELGLHSYLGPLLGLEEINYEPQKTQFVGVEAARWWGEACLKEYVLLKIKIEKLYDAFFSNKFVHTFLDIGPGLWELAILGKATSGLRGIGAPLPYDKIIIDSYSTGQTLSMLRVPGAMKNTILTGAMSEQCEQIESILKNSQQFAALCVTLAEESPVRETIGFIQELDQIIKQESQLLVNQVFLPPKEISSVQLTSWSAEQKQVADYIRNLSLKQQKHIDTLEKNLARPVSILPMVFVNGWKDKIKTLQAMVKL